MESSRDRIYLLDVEEAATDEVNSIRPVDQNADSLSELERFGGAHPGGHDLGDSQTTIAILPPSPGLSRDIDQNRLVGRLIVSNGNEAAPVSPLRNSTTLPNPADSPALSTENISTLPTVLTDDVSALQSIGSSYEDKRGRDREVSEEVLVDDEHTQAAPRFLERLVNISSRPTAALSEFSSDFDVPPPLPLLPSPPIRGTDRAPVVEGPGMGMSNVTNIHGKTGDDAAVVAKPTLLLSASSHDTIATSASMARESSFVREIGIDLDECVDAILHAKCGRSNEASQRLHHEKEQKPQHGKTKIVDEEKRRELQPSTGSDPAKTNTVNGTNCHSGTQGSAILTDEELPAIITPTLRRQGTTATPGAFRAGGAYGNNPTEPLPPPPPLSLSSTHSTTHSMTLSMTRQASTNVSRRLVRSFSYDSVDDSCRTPVTATLVTENEESRAVNEIASPVRREQPLVVAHAEPVEKLACQRKRRCILAWLFLAAVLGSALLGIATAFIITPSKNKDTPSLSPKEPAPNIDDDIETDFTLPDHNITDRERDIGLQSSSHVVMWGLVATCRDDAFFSQYALDLQCGGELRILQTTNAECFNRTLDREGNITDTSRASCFIRGKSSELNLNDGRVYYEESKALVHFDCFGRTLMEHAATASLPPMEIDDCSNEQRVSDRRNLRSIPVSIHKASSFSQGRSRALQEVSIGGGASSYMTIGRFCSEKGDWVLWHEWYECEKGDRFFFTELFGVYRSDVPSLDSVLSGNGGMVLSAFLQAVGLNTNGNSRRRLQAIGLNTKGNRRRRLQDIDDIPFGQIASYLGTQNFCFSKQTCVVDDCPAGESCACSVITDELIMSNYDPRSACRWTKQGPDLDERKRTVSDELDPEELVKRLAARI